MKVSLIVPWRRTPDRERVWNFLWPAWEAECHEVIVVDDDPPSEHAPWVKGRAWRRGVERSHHDVVCLMDADCWVPRLSEAVDLLERERWVQGQNMVIRFDERTTEKILRGEISMEVAAKDDQTYDDVVRFSSAGVGTILRREDALAYPMDTRFVGWGWEDCSWYELLTTMLGWPGKLPDSPCYHLWHRPQHDKNRDQGARSANWMLWRQYVRARGRPTRMQAVLDEVLQSE